MVIPLSHAARWGFGVWKMVLVKSTVAIIADQNAYFGALWSTTKPNKRNSKMIFLWCKSEHLKQFSDQF